MCASSDASITSKYGTKSGSRKGFLRRRGRTKTDCASRSTGSDRVHEPVMVDEVREHLAPSRGGLFVDCTLGLGGHARHLLEGGASRLIGFDRDPAAVAHVR